jgi:dihydroorotate dehydrogenase
VDGFIGENPWLFEVENYPMSSLLPYSLYGLARPFLFGFDPEHAHELTLDALARTQNTPLDCFYASRRVEDPVTLAGLNFPNRIGLAAGFDKNGRYIDALGALGFGFVEVGTVTPRAQPGQVRPRLFRLPGQRALINRMGFPNEGSAACAIRLARRTWRGVCGVNIGKNAQTPIARAIDDYVACYRAVAPLADYVAVNVSSPNTQDLRRLQEANYLQPIIEALIEQREALSRQQGRPVPLLIKISPDLSEEELIAVARLLLHTGVDAVIATNTTISRPGILDQASADVNPFTLQEGGMSGEPLRSLALRAIRTLRMALGANVPIIGTGGIACAADAFAAMEAGADLLQIYTGLVYRGPGLIRELRTARGAEH